MTTDLDSAARPLRRPCPDRVRSASSKTSSGADSPRCPRPTETRWATSGAPVAGKGAPNVVVTAHADQIGLIVTYVDEHGFVSFDKIGGVDPQLLPGRNLIVHGTDGPVNGVVGRKPSHKMSKDERAKAPDLSDQWLDLGCSTRDEALSSCRSAIQSRSRRTSCRWPAAATPRRRSTTAPAFTCACARSSTTPGRGRRRPHGAAHRARGDDLHGRQGHGDPLAAGRDHRRRCGLRQ